VTDGFLGQQLSEFDTLVLFFEAGGEKLLTSERSQDHQAVKPASVVATRQDLM